MPGRNMVFTSAGDNTRFDELWLNKNQTYDVYVIYFGNDIEVFKRYQSKVYFSERRQGSKFQNFYHFYKNYRDVIELYDYIFILDDDICMTHQDIESMFKFASDYDLLICQPSFTHESQISHAITKHIPKVILQYTNFVEVNTPLFKKEALIRLMDKYHPVLIGWGIDYLSIYANGIELTNKYAVIHAVQCTNPTIENKKYKRKELNIIENVQLRESIWGKFAYCHKYAPYYELKVHSTVVYEHYDKWVINLDDRVDRWAKFKNTDINRWKATNGYEICRWDALKDGVTNLSMWNTNCSSAEYYTSSKIENNHGKIGCWLSHKKLLQHLSTLNYDDDYKHLILEDDVCLDKLDECSNIFAHVPIDWDMVYVGIKTPDLSKPIGHDVFRGVTSFMSGKNYGTHAYFVKHGSIPGILEHLKYMTHEIDVQLNLLFDNKKVYIIYPPIVTLSTDNSSSSSIDNYDSYNAWTNHLLRIITPALGKLNLNTIPDLECFARIFAGSAPWLALNPANDKKLQILSKFDVLVYSDIFGDKQAIVECAYICYGFLLTQNVLWNQVSTETQLQFIKILRKVRNNIRSYHRRYNWYLFHGMIEAFLKSVNADYNNSFITEMIQTIESWYCGDGFYKDGERGFTMDYYNSYVIHPFYIEILKVTNPHMVSQAFDRCIRYSEFLERIIGSDGTYPPLGRSIVYRFGAFHALAYCIYNQNISRQHTYPQLQRALSKVMKCIITDLVFDSDGMLQLGFTGNQPCIADDYSSWGSCYLTTLGFLPLGLDKTHAFWSDSSIDHYSQELAWKYNMPFKKYEMIHPAAVTKPKDSTNVIFLLHGDKGNYGLSLTTYLNSHFPTVFVDNDDVASIHKNIQTNKVVVVYTANQTLKKQLVANRIIEIYIGLQEDLDCITILTHSESERIEASLNKFCLKCIQPRRVLLASPGGSACTAFLQLLEKTGITINSSNSFILGGDGLKHSIPNSHLVTAYDPTHILYQYGDLDSTIRSLFRRNLMRISYFYDYPQKFMNPLMRTTKKELKFNTLQEYINQVLITKEEPLGIIKHWKEWKSSNRNVYFVHYANIHKDKEIDKFLGVPDMTCSEFTVKKRESTVSDIETSEYLSILSDIDRRERTS
jgi:GR25 family glycosyltransferase involved in LPS biosynthesis